MGVSCNKKFYYPVWQFVKKTYGKFCWICGNPANSGEHKHKKTDLKRHFDNSKSSPDKVAYITKNDRNIEIQSIKSDKVKFDKVICKNCNETVSQPFDKSYVLFIDYILKNYNELLELKYIDFEDIYGETWQNQKRNLIRYYLKHIGCRLAVNNIEISPNLIAYINNKTNDLKDLLLRFEISCFLWNFLNKMKLEGAMYSNLYIGEMNYIPKENRECIDTLYTYYTNEWMKIHFIYSENLNDNLNWMNKFYSDSRMPILIEGLDRDYTQLYELTLDELMRRTANTRNNDFSLKKIIRSKIKNPFNIT